MAMLTEQIERLTDAIAENQHYLGDVNGDLSLAEGVRGTLHGMSIVLQHIGGVNEASVSASGAMPLMSPCDGTKRTPFPVTKGRPGAALRARGGGYGGGQDKCAKRYLHGY